MIGKTIDFALFIKSNNFVGPSSKRHNSGCNHCGNPKLGLIKLYGNTE